MSREWFAIYNSKTELFMEVAGGDEADWVKILWTDIDKHAYIMVDDIWKVIEYNYMELGKVGYTGQSKMSQKQSSRNSAVSLWMSEECNRARDHMFLIPCTDVSVNPNSGKFYHFTPDFEKADRLF